MRALIMIAILMGPIETEPYTYEIGLVSQYAPGVMQRTIRVRQAGRTSYDLPLILPEVDGYVAYHDCTMIGEIIELKPLQQEEYETFLIADCCGIADGGCSWMQRNEIWWEIDYESAVRLDTVGRAFVGVGRMGR